jgi:hypothetical protein
LAAVSLSYKTNLSIYGDRNDFISSVLSQTLLLCPCSDKYNLFQFHAVQYTPRPCFIPGHSHPLFSWLMHSVRFTTLEHKHCLHLSVEELGLLNDFSILIISSFLCGDLYCYMLDFLGSTTSASSRVTMG